jgi:hypothetical protein
MSWSPVARYPTAVTEEPNKVMFDIDGAEIVQRRRAARADLDALRANNALASAAAATAGEAAAVAAADAAASAAVAEVYKEAAAAAAAAYEAAYEAVAAADGEDEAAHRGRSGLHMAAGVHTEQLYQYHRH